MDQIEMWWKCSACGTINGGLSKKCGERVIKGDGCGKAQERESWFPPDDISSKAALTDETEIRQALAGADWYCGYCGSTQRRLDGECANCGGNRGFATEDRFGKTKFYDEYETPSEHTEVKAERRHQSTVSSSRKREDRTSRHWPWTGTSRHWPWIAGAGLLVLVVGLIIWLLTPRYVEAEVTAVAWTSTVTVERYQVIKEEGWDTPSDGFNVKNHGSRVHHYERVQVGSHQESYVERVACGQDCQTVSVPEVCTTTPRSCTPNGNGTMSCSGGDRVCSGGGTRQQCSTRYCNETRYRTVADYENQPRYRNWYSWNVWRWMENRKVVRRGSDMNPKPPESAEIALNVGCVGGEKERTNTGWEYINVFTYSIGKNTKTWTYKPKSENEYKLYPIGTVRTLKITGVGTSIKDK